MSTTFEIKSAHLNALSILIKSLSFDEFKSEFFSYIDKFKDLQSFPFILDLSLYKNPTHLPIAQIIALFKQNHIKIVAIQHYDENFIQLANQHNLIFQLIIKRNNDANINTANTAHKKTISSSSHRAQETATANEKTNQISRPTVIIDRAVRSGQQIYAEGSDLIITAIVGEGAEILADGNIHVYAPVRGRVIAGAAGNLEARIFIQSMQAQLVSIAGIYRIFDQKLPNSLYKKQVAISLQENKLLIVAINP